MTRLHDILPLALVYYNKKNFNSTHQIKLALLHSGGCRTDF